MGSVTFWIQDLQLGCIIDEKTGGCIRTVHAEENAIRFYLENKRDGIAKLYVTMSPCIECAELIIKSRIKEVIYYEDYRDKSGINLLKNNNVNVIKYNGRLF